MKFVDNQFLDISKIAIVDYSQGNCRVYFSGKLNSHLVLSISKEEMIKLFEESKVEFQDVENSFLFVRDRIGGIEYMGDQAFNFFFEDGSEQIFHLSMSIDEMKKIFLTKEEIEEMEEDDEDLDYLEDIKDKGSIQVNMIFPIVLIVIGAILLSTYIIFSSNFFR